VADQISALSELSEMVSRQNVPLDITEPEAPRRKSSRRSSSRRDRDREQEREREPEPARAPRERWGLPDLLAAASRDDEDEVRTTKRSRSGGGRRNRNNNEDRTQLHVVESLNSISMDIARALDHQAPAELWHRYKSGERNVFTKRLYTMRGQQLFDEIRHKYQDDPEFQDDVDRYVLDFERLIDQASDDDRDDMLVDTYLTSETGKVYLMLAHAAGRLD